MVTGGVLGLIPARGGSKRIPRKNIVDFHGKPMIAWTIEAALKSRVCSQLVVSTDDVQIAEIARALGAEVPFFRDACSDDTTPVSVATLYALQQAEAYYGVEYETVLQLMPNCPLRQADHIRAAMDNFHRYGADLQISCSRYGWLNPWWAFERLADGRATKTFPEAYNRRSQDLPTLYCPNGCVWIARGATLKKTKSFHSDQTVFHELPGVAAIDIDDDSDLELAKLIFAGQHT